MIMRSLIGATFVYAIWVNEAFAGRGHPQSREEATRDIIICVAFAAVWWVWKMLSGTGKPGE